MLSIKEKERQRAAFVDSVLAQAQECGISKAKLKAEAFGSYATGNRRIEHRHGELNLTDICNIATLCHLSPTEMITRAAANMARSNKRA